MDCETDLVESRGGDASKNNITDMLRKLATASQTAGNYRQSLLNM